MGPEKVVRPISRSCDEKGFLEGLGNPSMASGVIGN